MKKTIFTLFMVFSPVLLAETYIMNLNDNNKNSFIVEPYTENNTPTPPALTCIFPEVIDDSGLSCINTFDKVGWIDRNSDTCNGVRQMTANSNIFILRSITAQRIDNPVIPEGYSWLSYSEYQSLITNNSQYNYFRKCGLSGYSLSVEGRAQHEISFSDTSIVGQRTHAGTTEGQSNSGWNHPNNWLGIMVLRDN